MPLIRVFAALFAGFSAAIASAAAQSPVAVAPSVGTDGLGGDVSIIFSRHAALRGGYRYNDFSLSASIDGIRYDIELGFSSGVAALDIHPFANGFRLSGGAYFSPHKVDLSATPSRPVGIGGQTFTPAEVGVLTGWANWSNTAPFFGFGFNNGLKPGNHFGFQAMLGAAYIGSPEVNLQSQGGLLSDSPIFLTELAAEEQRVENKLDNFPFQPILNIGIFGRF